MCVCVFSAIPNGRGTTHGMQHTRAVTAVAFLDTGDSNSDSRLGSTSQPEGIVTIISASRDRTVKVWRLTRDTTLSNSTVAEWRLLNPGSSLLTIEHKPLKDESIVEQGTQALLRGVSLGIATANSLIQTMSDSTVRRGRGTCFLCYLLCRSMYVCFENNLLCVIL